MITVENLRTYGADVDEGIKRCLDDAGFYIELVESVIPDTRLEELEKLINDNDLDKAFEVAHALKGMYGNISLKPIYDPVCEITEHLRMGEKIDYSELINEAKAQKQKLIDIHNNRK